MRVLTERLSRAGFFQTALLSFLLGGSVALTLAPFHLIFLLPIAYSGLFLLLSTARTRWQTFFIGWWFGWGQFIAGLYWIGVAFTIDANAHAALIPLPVLALPAFLAIFPGLATLLTALIKGHPLLRVIAFAGLWTVMEYVRGVIFTGFPWNLAGYAWGDVPAMLQWTAYIGIYGLSLLTVLISTLPALLAETGLSVRVRNRAMILTVLLMAVMAGAGYWRLSGATTAPLENSDFRIVQPNVPQADKWKRPLRFGHVRKLAEMSAAAPAPGTRLYLWPETAVPFFLTTDDNLKQYLQRIVPEGGAIVTGAPRQSPDRREYWNSVAVLDSHGKIDATYDKQHLVPYGEYLPLRGFLETIGLVDLIPALDAMSDFSASEPGAGSVLQSALLPAARVLICYEVTFPWEINQGQPFEWLLNVTNDGWFGDTTGPYQHLVTSRVRAIEQGVALIRAANTGISAIVDPYGRVLASLPLNSEGVLDGQIPAPLPGRTLYARYGEILPLTLVLLCLLIGGIGHFRQRP
ncbi:apolipoprotein N-acyltransferase [Sneathiella chinensis]|uniref:Apolipoprotein N-acyltransferase n=1 Tax=Sneathiella chinensis TaxID=349750 RepID=A0ABQ5U0D9_9PROT|nr:apolipoprotein N-acyltransferase [Sneathiella chinensis]GLQ05203.1 apolipoprotein N-acyltransferase [Sneathiella chinensis]